MKKTLLIIATLAALVAGGAYVAGLSRSGESLQVLRIGVLPDDNPAVLQQRYAALIDYLEASTGIETRLVIPANYNDAVRLFADREVDLAYFGGFTFVQARARHGAEPLVMREIDTRFISWFVTRPDNSGLALSDFRDQTISFGSHLSTSGHLMPRHFLQRDWQIDAEKFFARVEYSGSHDKTVLLVRDGKVDLGAVNSITVQQMIANGRIGKDDVRIVWETPPYPDYVWAVQADLDEQQKTRLRDAFLELEGDVAEQRELLDAIGAAVFLPANPRDFEVLARVAEDLGLMRGETR